MKNLLFALSLTLASLTLALAPTQADAKRLGGGKSAGMQRQAPPANAAPAAAPAAAAAPATAGAAAAAAPKRNWMGPLAGLAAGLGLAALFSHLGMGAGLANFMMMALLAVAAFFVIRFLMRRFAGNGGQAANGPQLAGAGAPMSGWQGQGADQPATAPMQRNALDAAPQATALAGASAAAAAAPEITTLPGGMAAADFERLAKMIFIRMQAANDASNLDDLRKFTTPELFSSLRLDLQDRGSVKQQTDVVQIDAKVAEVAQDKGQDIVSVRFQGLIRESAESGAEAFHELWHLVRPTDGSADWAIAGITPVQ